MNTRNHVLPPHPLKGGGRIRITVLGALIACAISAAAQINVSQVVTIGRNALYFEDYVLSIQYFNQAINADSTQAEPYFYRSVAKINLDDYQGAEQDATRAIDIKPFIVDAFRVRAVARQNQGNYAGAISDYDAGLRLRPEDKMLIVNKAVCLGATKDYDGAQATYDRLLAIDPRNDRAHLGLAHLCLERGDTVAARQHVDRSIELSKNNAGAYVIRAEIQMRHDSDYAGALESLNEAIKLEPRQASYFVNRAFMKYKLDDYFGAMADYDYAIGLDPASVEAHFNRALLYTEVGEYNKAINDYSFVLKGDPDNFMARYNRAMVYMQTGENRRAVADLTAVIEKYPDFESGFIARAQAKQQMGDRRGSQADYDHAMAMFRSKHTRTSDYDPAQIELEKAIEARQRGEVPTETEGEVINRFNTLLTVTPENPIKPEYDNKQRGRIQDANVEVEPQPAFELTYYSHDNKLNGKTHYLREIAEVNDSHALPRTLTITGNARRLTDDEIAACFASIEYYNSLISTNPPRSIDYFARALDYLLVKDTDRAIADCDRALALNPDFALAYMLRAAARDLAIDIRRAASTEGLATAPAMDSQASAVGHTTAPAVALHQRQDAADMDAVIADLDSALAISPKNPYALYNKALVLVRQGNLTEAISCYSAALTIKPDLAEAYYNRGITYLRLGNRQQGVADLSKAGELGILPSYNVLKRMSR